MNSALYHIRADLGTLHQQFLQGIEWYKQEMHNLKEQLVQKDKEIKELKKLLNEKSS